MFMNVYAASASKGRTQSGGTNAPGKKPTSGLRRGATARLGQSRTTSPYAKPTGELRRGATRKLGGK